MKNPKTKTVSKDDTKEKVSKKTETKEKVSLEKKVSKEEKEKVNLIIQSEGKKNFTCELQNVELAFVYLQEPVMFENKISTASYQVTALIPEKEFSSIRKTFERITNSLADNFKGSKKDLLRKDFLNFGGEDSFVKSGNTKNKNFDNLKDKFLLRAKVSAVHQEDDTFLPKNPILLKKGKEEIAQENCSEDFYSGMIANLIVTFAYYESGSNQGITTYLKGIQFVSKGERHVSSKTKFSNE